MLAAVVLPWSRAVSPPEKNINWTFGLGAARVRWPAPLYVAVLFLGFVSCVFVPTHLVLLRVFA